MALMNFKLIQNKEIGILSIKYIHMDKARQPAIGYTLIYLSC